MLYFQAEIDFRNLFQKSISEIFFRNQYQGPKAPFQGAEGPLFRGSKAPFQGGRRPPRGPWKGVPFPGFSCFSNKLLVYYILFLIICYINFEW